MDFCSNFRQGKSYLISSSTDKTIKVWDIGSIPPRLTVSPDGMFQGTIFEVQNLRTSACPVMMFFFNVTIACVPTFMHGIHSACMFSITGPPENPLHKPCPTDWADTLLSHRLTQ